MKKQLAWLKRLCYVFTSCAIYRRFRANLRRLYANFRSYDVNFKCFMLILGVVAFFAHFSEVKGVLVLTLMLIACAEICLTL